MYKKAFYTANIYPFKTLSKKCLFFTMLTSTDLTFKFIIQNVRILFIPRVRCILFSGPFFLSDFALTAGDKIVSTSNAVGSTELLSLISISFGVDIYVDWISSALGSSNSSLFFYKVSIGDDCSLFPSSTPSLSVELYLSNNLSPLSSIESYSPNFTASTLLQ